MAEASEQPARAPRPALVCLGVVATYAVASLVLFPEGDPSPGARALALVAILAASGVAVAVARWGPAWLRGTGMLVVGFGALSVLLSVVAERVLRTPSIPIVLGALAGVAGVVLIVVGWQRLLGGLRRRWVRVTAGLVGTVVVLQLLVLPAVVALLVTNRARPEASGRSPADVGLDAQDVRITMPDGVELAAWWVPAANGTAVVLLPGSGSTRDDLLDHAAFVAEAGYGVLLVDVRGHGDSGGRLMDLGWGAHDDVAEIVGWLEARDVERVGLFGLSMGGEIALTAAAFDPRIDAVVAEGATARTYRDGDLAPEANPVARAVRWVQYALVGALAPEAEPTPLIDAVARIDAPTLLIEGGGPLEQEVGPLLDEAGPAVTLWSIPETPHVGGLSTLGQGYRDRVLAWLDRTIG